MQHSYVKDYTFHRAARRHPGETVMGPGSTKHVQGPRQSLDPGEFADPDFAKHSADRIDRSRIISMVSRRQVLSGATYGLGATLLFVRPRVDVIGDAVPTPAKGTGRGVTDRDSRAAPHHGARFDSMMLSGDGQPRSVCKGPRGVIVVGANDDGAPISWMNEGHADWHQATLARPVASRPEVWGVTADRDEFVAVGSMLQSVTETPSVPAEKAAGSSRRRPAIWWTHDGLEWNGTTLDVGERHANLISVACGDHLMVAVGSTLDADGVQGDGAFALASTDGGDTWQVGDIAQRDASLSEGSFTGIIHYGGTWLATSTDINGGALWTSPDGLRWSTIPGSARQFRGVALRGLAAHGGRVFLAGTTLTDQSCRFLASTDRCRTWRPLRNGPTVLAGAHATVTDLTVMSGEVVVVGTKRGRPVIEGGEPDGMAD